jgi:hypothetical protein
MWFVPSHDYSRPCVVTCSNLHVHFVVVAALLLFLYLVFVFSVFSIFNCLFSFLGVVDPLFILLVASFAVDPVCFVFAALPDQIFSSVALLLVRSFVS